MENEDEINFISNIEDTNIGFGGTDNSNNNINNGNNNNKTNHNNTNNNNNHGNNNVIFESDNMIMDGD